MKKRAILIVAMFFFVASLTANEGITLNIGGAYSNVGNFYKGTVGPVTGKIVRSANLGGADIGIAYGFSKNFGVYGLGLFAFGKNTTTKTTLGSAVTKTTATHRLAYEIDSQIGLYYKHDLPVRGLAISIGLGIGLGANGTESKDMAGVVTSRSIFGVGGGINVQVSYMVTKALGIYVGLSDTVYTPVTFTTKVGTIETKLTGSDIQGATIGKISNSFNARVGLQLEF